MWNVYKSESDIIAALEKEGFRRVGQYWERGERFVSFCRVEIGKCNDGQWVTMPVAHTL